MRRSAGDDGLASAARRCQGENASLHRLCLNFTFLSEKCVFVPKELSRRQRKAATDVNLILAGLDDAMSGMESIFLNGVYPLGTSHEAVPTRRRCSLMEELMQVIAAPN